MKALRVLLVLCLSLHIIGPAEASEASMLTRVYGKILMADCSGLLVKASASSLKSHCVVVYSGIWTRDIDGGVKLDAIGETLQDETEPSSNGRTITQSAEGNFAFAPQELNALSYVGKNVVLEITDTSTIKSLRLPE